VLIFADLGSNGELRMRRRCSRYENEQNIGNPGVVKIVNDLLE
jgi:hypothetical protein